MAALSIVRAVFQVLVQGSNPSAPPSGSRLLFPKSDGWYDEDSAGTVMALDRSLENLTFSKTGTLATSTGVLRLPIHGGTFSVVSMSAMVNTAPTGAAVILDVNKNGTTIFTTQANRPTIAVSTNTSTQGTPDVTSVTTGDYITVDVDQIGSTVAGANLTFSIRLRRTA